MAESKYFPNLQNGKDNADVEQIEQAFFNIETDVNNILNTKQDILTFDDTPTVGSANPVTSGGIKSALDFKADKSETYTKTEVDNKDNTIKSDIETLKQKSVPHTTASDYPLTVADHLEGEDVINYHVYGNSVQDGIPTPETPIEIQSVGDLVTDTTSEYYGKYDIPVRVSGKNLLNLNRIGVSPSSLDADIVRDETSYIKRWAYWNAVDTRGSGTYEITDSGFTVNNGCGSIGFPMKIERGKTYTLSVQNCTISGDVKQYNLTATCYNANGEYIKNYIQANDYINHLTVDTSSGVYQETEYIVWSVRRSANYNTMTVEGIQVEEGNTATSYEPYIAPVTANIYLDEPLRKSGDYADYIDWENQKVMRQIEVLDDTGTKPIDQSLGILEASTEETITVPVISAPNSDIMHISTDTKVPPSKIDLTYYQDINKVITNLTNAILAQGGNV